MEIYSSQLWSVLLDHGLIACALKEITGKNGITTHWWWGNHPEFQITPLMNNWLAKVLHSEMLNKAFHRLVKGFLQDYLQLPATWVAKTVLPPRKGTCQQKRDHSKRNCHLPAINFQEIYVRFQGCDLCMTVTGGLGYFFRAETKKETFSWPLPESYQRSFLSNPSIKKIGHTQWTWVYWVFPTPLGQTFERFFGSHKVGVNCFFSRQETQDDGA